MPTIGYQLIQRNKLIGAGVTTYKAILQGDIKLRGLRMSVYGKKDLYKTKETSYWDYWTSPDTVICQGCEYSRSKGATGIYIEVPGVGKMGIINCHLPFSSGRLNDKGDKVRDQENLQWQNNCYNQIYRELVKDRCKYVIWMGDFNYRVTQTDAKLLAETIQKLSKEEEKSFFNYVYTNYDELLEQMKLQNVYPLLEGVNNEGPLFYPTCKLEHYRLGMEYKTGRNNQRCPSWTDRILYTGMTCTSYTNWNNGIIMKMSDHDAVIGTYEIPYLNNSICGESIMN